MGRTLKIYMIDGTETGPRTVDIGNWSGRGVFSERGAIQEVLNREELSNPGVYCLKYTPKSDIFSERIYIGESENLKVRIATHLSNPDKGEFIEFIGFFSKDELLTKSHVRYLESRIIQLARDANSAEVVNINCSESFLSEADKSDMEFFLDQIKLILPVMGFRFLISDFVKMDNTNSLGELSSETGYFIVGKKIKARMFESERGFIVKKGSQAKKNTTKSIDKGYLRIREKLITSGKLIAKGSVFEFQENTVFNSTTAASSVVLGRKAPGPIHWVDSENRTYKDVQKDKFS
jgi:hypothetical protein